MTESPQIQHKQNSPPAKPTKRWHLFLTNAGLLVVAIGMGLMVIYGLYSYKAYKIPAASMEPALLIGDHIITLRFFADQKPDRGDIVVFPYPDDRQKEFVKRVVGLPGEKLKIRKQKVYINDKTLDEPYAQHTEPPKATPVFPRDDFGPVMIPDEYFFVLGDNRENSIDSRLFGPLEVKDIVREVKIIYWSWNNEESTIRWERIGKIPE